MDRFSQLEFGEVGPEERQGQGEPVRDAGYFYKEAVKYWLSGDFEPALRNYSRALERNGTLFEAWVGQVLMLIELGEYREAVIWSDRAMELFPQHPELLAVKAIACYRDAKKEKAMAYSDNSINKGNPTARVWLARAEVMPKQKNLIAETCIGKAIAAAGEDAAIIKLEAGRLLRKCGSYSAAIGYLHEVARALPKSALVWYELGCCQAELGFSEAKATLRQSLKLRPGWEKAEKALARCKGEGFFRRLFGR